MDWQAGDPGSIIQGWRSSAGRMYSSFRGAWGPIMLFDSTDWMRSICIHEGQHICLNSYDLSVNVIQKHSHKNLHKIGTKRIELKSIKTYIMLNREKLKAFPPDLELGKGVPFHHSFTTVSEILTRAIREENGWKSIKIGKEKIKLLVYVMTGCCTRK